MLMFTCVGAWVDDVLEIEYTILGNDHADHRPDWVGGRQSWCASIEADSREDAEAALLAEYDPENNTKEN